jgi:hypothetical protein
MTVRAGAYATCMRRTKYTREVLEPVVNSSKSLADVMRKLGLEPTGGNYRHISLRIRRSGVDISHFKTETQRARIKGIDADVLRELVVEHESAAAVTRALGLPPNGRAPVEVAARIRSLGLDTSHFTGSAWSRGKSWATDDRLRRARGKVRLRDEDVFIANSPLYAGSALIPRLLERGWPYACAWCGVTEWRDRRLVLHLDHINGIHNDNRLENLRLLCPNCHSQTDTYSNRRRD